MKQITINLYSYEELPSEIQEKVLQNMWDINIDHPWHEFIYEDAETIGLKINGFDLYRGNYVKAEFISDPLDTAQLILKNHGSETETYKTAQSFLEDRNKELTSYKNEEDSEPDLTDLENDFLQSLSEDYRIMLQKSYDYLTSEKAIIETIEANEYTFTIEGKLMNA